MDLFVRSTPTMQRIMNQLSLNDQEKSTSKRKYETCLEPGTKGYIYGLIDYDTDLRVFLNQIHVALFSTSTIKSK